MRTVADIQIDIDIALQARRDTLAAQSYNLDTGQGKQSVSRADLDKINATLRELNQELEDASGSGGNLYGTMERY